MRLIVLLCYVMLGCCCNDNTIKPTPEPEVDTPPFFMRGLDLSFTPEMNSNNVAYKSNGVQKELLQLVKEKGINTVRLRLWNNPATVHSSLAEVSVFAREIKAAGLKFWLDFHYSDTWADPGAQTKPAAWKDLNIAVLKDSIYAYTKNTLDYLQQNNASPDFIETGNEINNGLLWNDGKITWDNNTTWANFTSLLQEAVKGARAGAPASKIIIHFAGYEGAEQYFDKLKSFSTDYDIIGLSYYAWWHGKSMGSLQQAMQLLTNTFNKPVMIAETAYPFTPGWNDQTNNIIGTPDQLISGYAATQQGQADYMTMLINTMKAACDKENAGVCYWAPEWVAFKGDASTDGSPWENLALFDFSNNALPALDSLGKH